MSRYRFIVFVFFVLQSSLLFAEPQKLYHPPLEWNYISGSFGEYRPYGRYHQGIDYKTFGLVALPVYAPADGWLYRMIVSDQGYGNALFIGEPSLLFTFAHLMDFSGSVGGVEEIRRAVELLDPDEYASIKLPRWFYFKQGDRIARTGESGLGPPHLHFEIYHKGQYLNPLYFLKGGVPDTTSPRLTHLYIEESGRIRRYPLTVKGRDDITSSIGVSSQPTPHTVLFTTNKKMIEWSGGEPHLMVGGYDTMNATNRNSFPHIKVFINDKLTFENHLQALTPNQLDQASLTYDLTLTDMGDEYVYRAGSAQHVETQDVRIETIDASGNRAHLEFRLKKTDSKKNIADMGELLTDAAGRAGYVKVYGRGERITHNGTYCKHVSLFFPPGSLHRPAWIKIDSDSEGITVHHESLFLKRGAVLTIQCDAERDVDGLYEKRNLNISFSNHIVQALKQGESRIYRVPFTGSRFYFEKKDTEPPRLIPTILRDRSFGIDPLTSEIVREYSVKESDSGVDENKSKFYLNGEPYRALWVKDQQLFRVSIPASMIDVSGSLLTFYMTDRSGNRSSWYGERIMPVE